MYLPGVIHTAMIERFTGGDREVQEQLAEGQPLGRMGKPQEIAEVVTWLCSDAAFFVTGHAMAVDGGFVAQ
jgi:NAD(P)-dependent dehydrogenase (short-subunit alcohol dehydrogenase family)